MSKIDLYKGDCLEVMKTIEKESIDLIYIDPPFGIKQDEKFNMVAWKKTDYYEKRVYDLFRSILNENDLKFLSFLYPRLKKMRELLSEKGSIYIHIDWHVGHYVKVLLDEIFGKENFVNEIVWSYKDPSGTVKDRYKRKHDVIFFYTKNESSHIFNLDDVREPYSEGTLKQAETGAISFGRATVVNENGKVCDDVWSIPIINSMAKERMGYSTQKPEALLERIIKASSNENSIVADFFGGSGTTIAVAKKLGRRGIYCDQNQKAFDIAKKRIEDTVVAKGLFKNV